MLKEKGDKAMNLDLQRPPSGSTPSRQRGSWPEQNLRVARKNAIRFVMVDLVEPYRSTASSIAMTAATIRSKRSATFMQVKNTRAGTETTLLLSWLRCRKEVRRLAQVEPKALISDHGGKAYSRGRRRERDAVWPCRERRARYLMDRRKGAWEGDFCQRCAASGFNKSRPRRTHSSVISAPMLIR